MAAGNVRLITRPCEPALSASPPNRQRVNQVSDEPHNTLGNPSHFINVQNLGLPFGNGTMHREEAVSADLASPAP